MSNWLQDDNKNIWHPFTPLSDGNEPLLIESAKGIYLHTPDGRKIIDAISSWWVNIHGHSNAEIAKAIAEQANKLEHVIFAGFTHEPAITLSRNLLSILPDNQTKIFFSDDGSTSVEVALKMAFQYSYNQSINKSKVIAIKGAYHGDTFGAMSVGDRSIFTKPFNPFLFDVAFIDFPTAQNESKVLEQFKTLIDSGEICSFIFEPLVQGAAGMRMYSASLLDSLIEYAQQHHVICIADEVFTGFGRTGKYFASHHLNSKPDIMCLSKGLTGGTLPMGITTCSQKIVEAFDTSDFYKTFFHGHSYTANPLACAAANASFKLLIDLSCHENIKRITLKHTHFINGIGIHKKLKEVRQLGTIIALELDQGETHYANDIRKKIYNYFLQKDILLRPLGNVIYILPPYIITNEELEIVYNAIRKFLEEELK